LGPCLSGGGCNPLGVGSHVESPPGLRLAVPLRGFRTRRGFTVAAALRR